jgi:hypothetical protein
MIKQKEKQLCECGCGNYAKPGNRFIDGHNRCKTPWKPKPELQLCECGCGEYVNPGKRFIAGHQGRGEIYWKSKQESKLCECGCGNYAEPGKQFILGHQSRGEEYWKQQEGPQLCECGCGGYAKSGSRFIHGHNQKGKINPKKLDIKPKSEPQLCECGCGELTKPGNRFINHHWLKSNNPNPEIPKPEPQLCECGCGELTEAGNKFVQNHQNRNRKQSEEMCKAKRLIMIERYNDPEAHERTSAALQHIPYDEWEDFACKKLYCPDFNEECRESNRDKYGRMCFLTGLLEEGNITQNGKHQRLSVHHVDMDKGQGCNDKRWKLVPLCIGWHAKVHNSLWESRIIWLLDNVWN